MRTFDMPKWLIYLPMALGLWLSAVELLRYLLGLDSMYARRSGRDGGLLSMNWQIALALMMGVLLALMGIGLPVAFAFFVTNIVCIYLFFGGSVGVEQMVSNFSDAVSVYALTPMPLFLIMGSLFFRSGLGEGVFKSLDMCIGNLRARLSYLVVLAGAVFASLSGSSMANTAMMGTTMVPEMLAAATSRTWRTARCWGRDRWR